MVGNRDWRAYLHFGYLPPENPTLPFSLPSGQLELPKDFKSASKELGRRFRSVVRRHLVAGKAHYIPLSGGLDSRGLLATALDDGVEVRAITFGTPGTLDYDCARIVADSLNLHHESLNLEEWIPDTSDLVGAVLAGGSWTYTFDAYFNRLLRRLTGSDSIVLSGFLGDPLAGAHYAPPFTSSDEARRAFINSQSFTRAGMLLRSDMDPHEWLPANNVIPNLPGIRLYERLDLCVRQTSAIYPIVVDPGVDSRTPFSDPEWVATMLFAPGDWRQNCRLYEAALFDQWPMIFSLPTKNYRGLGLGSRPLRRRAKRLSRGVASRLARFTGIQSNMSTSMINYIDFDRLLIESRSLRELARENLCDLKRRGIMDWLDPEWFLEHHRRTGPSYSKEIQVLIGLEINLKAQCV